MLMFIMFPLSSLFFFFFFNDTATTEIYTLSLHDALPISRSLFADFCIFGGRVFHHRAPDRSVKHRSEEHTSELQSRSDLVCRLLLEKKKNQQQYTIYIYGRTTHGSTPAQIPTTHSEPTLY